MLLFWSCSQKVQLPKADQLREQAHSFVYKTIDASQLELTFLYPPDFDKSKKYPALIFFFGGGWKGGTTKQFEPQARYFAERGLVSVLADYRVSSRHGTTPFDAVRDAKSAIRFLRKYAKQLHLDDEKIIAAGGSAGGHLAAAAGNIVGLEEPGEQLKISSKPNALVLFNPVFDNGPDGYGYERIGERYPEISPLHNITAGAPPTIVFLGSKDPLIPVATAELYQQKMEVVGSRCDLQVYEGQSHGFFNYNRSPEHYYKTLRAADIFLASLGYLEGEPTIQAEPETK